MKNNLHSLTFLPLLLGMLVVAPEVLEAQIAIKQDKLEQQPKNPVEIKVFKLRYANSESVVESIHSLLEIPDLRISIDERTNAIFVRGTPEAIAEVSQLIELLDDARSQNSDVDQIQVYSVDDRELEASVQIVDALKMPVSIAATHDGTIIARGFRSDLEMVGELLRVISKSSQDKIEDVTVKIMWLTEAKVEGAPRFVDPLEETLSKRGFNGLSVLSVVEVTTRLGEGCEAMGAAATGSLNCTIELSGNQGDITMDLGIDASYMAQGGDDQLMLQSSVSTPLNKTLIFGVAQRRGAEASKSGLGLARDLFLVRLEEVVGLED